MRSHILRRPTNATIVTMLIIVIFIMSSPVRHGMPENTFDGIAMVLTALAALTHIYLGIAFARLVAQQSGVTGLPGDPVVASSMPGRVGAALLAGCALIAAASWGSWTLVFAEEFRSDQALPIINIAGLASVPFSTMSIIGAALVLGMAQRRRPANRN